MVFLLIGLALLFLVPTLLLGGFLYLHSRAVNNYLPRIVRIFQERPLFIVPRGEPDADAEEVWFPTSDGLKLHGCYLRTPHPRRGVLLFGLEFGSNCWSARNYCEQLLQGGFDVFAFETRNQGQSDKMPGYEPLQWVTDYEVTDTCAALAYLKSRPDADPRGVGLFGISKGAGAGILAAANDPTVRCCVTDGLFGTLTTLVPYMRQWFRIYNTWFPIQIIQNWYYNWIARLALEQVQQQRHCRFPSLETALRRLGNRPVLMIHGEQDTYIKPDMARDLFEQLRGPREFWLVEKAKHNQALHVAPKEYASRVLRFFEQHLAGTTPTEVPTPAVGESAPLAKTQLVTTS